MAEVEVNGVRLRFDVTGNGPPVVFVHGMCGRGAVWAGQVDRLSDEFTCVTYDRRGHGSSSDAATPHSVPLHGDDFAALVTALGFGPVLYVGSSGGARVGVDVILRHPGLLAGAVLSEPPVVSLDPERGKQFLDRVVPAVQPLLEAGDLPAAVDAFFDVVCPGLWRQLDDAAKEPYRRSGPMLVADLRQPPLDVRPEDLAAVRLPVLALLGLDSAAFLQSTPRVIAASVPSARLVELADCGHVTYAERPDAFAAPSAPSPGWCFTPRELGPGDQLGIARQTRTRDSLAVAQAAGVDRPSVKPLGETGARVGAGQRRLHWGGGTRLDSK